MKKPSRTPLRPEEIIELLKLVRTLFDFHAKLRQSNLLAQLIQFPKTPTRLSESIVCHAAASGLLLPDNPAIERIFLGGKEGDVIIQVHDNRPRRIEVKAAASSSFSQFGEKDVTADYLIWLDFGMAFKDSTINEVTAHVLPDPGKYVTPGKISLQTFLKLSDKLRAVKINPETLKLNPALFDIPPNILEDIR
ncbi:MAG TPA: hypothetical protein VH370_10515 [Humisphaera sp.]|jgi:hypothetical protein|nr:hypothetical protein [Humisphaera sp.]